MSDLARPNLPPIHLAQYALLAALMTLQSRKDPTLDQPVHQLLRAVSLLAEADPTLPIVTLSK